jgi:transcription initiation factor IIE alpha subunit
MQINLPAEVVRSVLASFDNADEAMKKLQEYSRARAVAESVALRIKAEREACEKRIEALKSDLICQHEITKPYGDTYGNANGSQVCLICGQTIKSKDNSE